MRRADITHLFADTEGAMSSIVLSRWLNATIIFIPMAVMLTYGVLHGFLFGVSILFATMVSQRLLKNKVGEKGHVRTAQFIKQETGLSNHLVSMMFKLLSYSQLFLLALGGGMVLAASLNVSKLVGILLFLILTIPILVTKFRMHHRHRLKVGLLFVIMTSLLVYVFVTKSTDELYLGVRLYHPYLLYVNVTELVVFLLAIFFIFVGMLILDPVTWYYRFLLKKQEVFRGSYFGMFVWAALPLAFSAITITMIYEGGFEDLTSIFHNLFQYFQNEIIVILFTVAILFVLLDSFDIELRVLSMYQNRANVRSEQAEWTIKTLPLLVFAFVFPLLGISLLDIFIWMGILYVSLLCPFIVYVFSKRTYSRMTPVASSIGALIGWGMMVWGNHIEAVFYALGSSGIICAFFYLKEKNRREPNLN
ncbi:hypothetical protein RZN22_16505 [Bacillaceae bacterium S4-13-58]